MKHHLEARISLFLWVGNLLANGVIALGLIARWLTGRMGYPPGSYPTRPSAILEGVLVFRPGAVISLGVVLLLLLPAGRIILLGWGYLRRKEYPLAAVSLTVLLVLIVALMLGVSH